jgi:hypothetical protein
MFPCTELLSILLAETVPANKELLAGTIPAN